MKHTNRSSLPLCIIMLGLAVGSTLALTRYHSDPTPKISRLAEAQQLTSLSEDIPEPAVIGAR